MLKNISSIVKTRFVSIVFGASLLMNVVLYIILYLRIPRLDQITLHYNIFFGIDLLGAWHQVFGLPILGSVVIIVNFILLVVLYDSEKTLVYFAGIVAALTQVFLLMGGILLVLLNL